MGGIFVQATPPPPLPQKWGMYRPTPIPRDLRQCILNANKSFNFNIFVTLLLLSYNQNTLNDEYRVKTPHETVLLIVMGKLCYNFSNVSQQTKTETVLISFWRQDELLSSKLARILFANFYVFLNYRYFYVRHFRMNFHNYINCR